MKNIILIVVITAMGLLPVFTYAQVQPPNANFEDWTTLTNGAENPTGWGSSNFAVGFGVPQSIFRTTDAIFGEFALKVITPSVGTTIYTTQAELNEGAFDDGGLPYTDRPLNMAAWVKGTIYPGDTAFVRAWLTRWDSDLQVTEFIGEAYIGLSSIDTVYALRLDSFNYVSNAQPDTLYLVAGFGDHDEVTVNADNQFFVDNIVFTGLSTGTLETTRLEGVSIFPNPNDGWFSVRVNKWNGEAVRLRLYHPSGKLLAERKISNNNETLVSSFEMPELSQGIYFLEMWVGEQKGVFKMIKN